MATALDRLLNLARYGRQAIEDAPSNLQRAREVARTVFSQEPEKVQQRHQFYESNIREPVFQKIDKSGKAAPVLRFLASQSLGGRGSPPPDISSPEFQEKVTAIALGMQSPLAAMKGRIKAGNLLRQVNPA